MGRYDNVQHGWFHWILHMLGLVPMVLGFVLRDELDGGGPWLAGVGVLMQVIASAFWRLRVHDDGDALRIAYGPLPLISKRIPYGSIRAFEPTRSSWVDGWGIHWGPGRGWTWNLVGFDCVLITDDRGKTLRLGTDDQDGLVAHLTRRVPHAAPKGQPATA